MPFEMDRSEYATRYGPTKGDRLRLGDTDLWLTIDEDYSIYGDEPAFGYAKTMRPGMAQAARASGESQLDAVILGAVVVDPVLGVFKGDIGIKDGRIAAIGRAGNPETGRGIDVVIGPTTYATFPVMANGLIATPGGVDSHVHLLTPTIIQTALAAGITTLISAGFDEPLSRMHTLLRALESFPVNVGVAPSVRTPHKEITQALIEGGACGLKVHEDYAATPAVIDAALQVADEMDVCVALHTDGLNEAVEVEDTVEAIAGRTVHAYHIEGTGGGHVPDLIKLVREPNIICSSTTPTVPYTPATAAEHHEMIMQIHGLNPHVPSERETAAERIHPATMAAEGPLHELGAISIINSDSQGMGRIGETIRRTWQLAHVMKHHHARETGAADMDANDNDRILQYLAKHTINPAITHGIAEHVGSLQVGRLADIVLWRPAMFGVKPQAVIKGGLPAWGLLGEGNASLASVEPLTYGGHWGGIGAAPAHLSAIFVSKAAHEDGIAERLRTQRQLLPVSRTRRIRKKDMVRNNACPPIEVDPQRGTVTLDGRLLAIEPATSIPLNRRYFL